MARDDKIIFNVTLKIIFGGNCMRHVRIEGYDRV